MRNPELDMGFGVKMDNSDFFRKRAWLIAKSTLYIIAGSFSNAEEKEKDIRT